MMWYVARYYQRMSYSLLWYEWLAMMRAIVVTCGSTLDTSSCVKSNRR